MGRHDVSSCINERAPPVAHLALAPHDDRGPHCRRDDRVSFLVGALIEQGGFPALIVVGLPSVIGGVVAFTRPHLRPYAAGFLVAWFSALVVVGVVYLLLVAALAGAGG